MLVLVVTAACSERGRSGRVIVLGIDGLEPTVIDLLISEGQLPNLARLRREGAHDTLTSSHPLLSPIHRGVREGRGVVAAGARRR